MLEGSVGWVPPATRGGRSGGHRVSLEADGWRLAPPQALPDGFQKARSAIDASTVNNPEKPVFEKSLPRTIE
jgi:hypothetical protein